ncbi:MAG: hypothetical protein RLZZ428_1090 [Pseudomonadota bacterium]|jgi:uncharacterized RDD family membrane protein YckC
MNDETNVIYAGFWKRFAAYIIDFFVLFIPSFIIGFTIGMTYGNILTTDELEGLNNLVGIVISWLYWAVMESSPKQATLGKMALGIKVTNLNGERISFARASGRFFGKIVSSLLLLIGFIMIAITKKKQGLHDKMAGTLIVNQ